MVSGRVEPRLRDVPALAGVLRRNYDYDRFWMVFPLRTDDGQPLFGRDDLEAELVVRIYDKEGRITWHFRTCSEQNKSGSSAPLLAPSKPHDTYPSARLARGSSYCVVALTRFAPLVVCLVVAGCGGGESPTAPSASSVPHQNERQDRVDRTNQYRAQVGRPAYGRSTALETYADAAAKHDGTVRQPHDYFRMTGGGGIAFAENEIIRWSTAAGIENTIRDGLALFWSEGSSGGHYRNMTSTRTPRWAVDCSSTGGAVTVVQAFR